MYLLRNFLKENIFRKQLLFWVMTIFIIAEKISIAFNANRFFNFFAYLFHNFNYFLLKKDFMDFNRN